MQTLNYFCYCVFLVNGTDVLNLTDNILFQFIKPILKIISHLYDHLSFKLTWAKIAFD